MLSLFFYSYYADFLYYELANGIDVKFTYYKYRFIVGNDLKLWDIQVVTKDLDFIILTIKKEIQDYPVNNRLQHFLSSKSLWGQRISITWIFVAWSCSLSQPGLNTILPVNIAKWRCGTRLKHTWEWLLFKNFRQLTVK